MASIVPRTAPVVCLLGPPASGKSTLSKLLEREQGARVVRLRELHARLRDRPALAARLTATHDPLGWLPDGTVRLVLTTVLGEQPELLRSQRLVVFENFPGTAAQVGLLASVLGHADARVDAVVELLAPDAAVRERAAARLVCPGCEPLFATDPHLPAEPAPERPGRCRACGAALRRRSGDQPERLAQRLARYRQHLPAIRRAVRELGIPYHQLDTTLGPGACAQAAQCLLQPASAPGRGTHARTPAAYRHPDRTCYWPD